MPKAIITQRTKSTKAFVLFISFAILSMLQTTLGQKAIAQTVETPTCNTPISYNWVDQAMHADFDLTSPHTKAIMLNAGTNPFEYKFYAMDSGVELRLERDPTTAKTKAVMRVPNDQPDSRFYYVSYWDFEASPKTWKLPGQGIVSPGTEIVIGTNINCVEFVRNATYLQTGFSHPTVMPTNTGSKSWSGAIYRNRQGTTSSATPTPTNPPQTQPTDLTPRDEKLIGLALAMFIGYLTIRQFRWRHHG